MEALVRTGFRGMCLSGRMRGREGGRERERERETIRLYHNRIFLHSQFVKLQLPAYYN